MSDVMVNLTRKWRSKNFEQIVGQAVPVKMLKNSLYLGHFFPVYLFAGTRGCGKTSTARVFAAAINCEQLPEFQRNPAQAVLPCLTCASCRAMAAGKHPDFIEIDAASNTGVDNMRQIIDSSSLLPLIGRKKIYLIDEAHMLSKAAFNALLKILEEPPTSALFMLATTDAHKIIDTVKSRCFQMFFKPVEEQQLHEHLKKICHDERIASDERALSTIIQETNGCVRDAMNLLEQVRFSSGSVTHEAVLRVLGHVDDERLLSLFEQVLRADARGVLTLLATPAFQTCSVEFVWRKLIDLMRAALWVKHGATPTTFTGDVARLKKMVQDCSWQRLNAFLDLLISEDHLLSKTTAQHALLEMMLLKICLVQGSFTPNDSNNSPSSVPAPLQEEPVLYVDEDEEEEEESDEEAHDMPPYDEQSFADRWQLFITELETLCDPMIGSVLRQGRFVSYDPATAVLEVEYSKDFIFFSDALEPLGTRWFARLKELFGTVHTFKPLFTGPAREVTPRVVQPADKQTPVAQPRQPVASSAPKYAQAQNKPAYQQQRTGNSMPSRAPAHTPYRMAGGKTVDVSDKEVWKKTDMILRYFSGTITEIQESPHE